MGNGPVLSELLEEECWSLLAASEVGRLAVAIDDDSPLVVPVNYALDGRAIVVRTDDGAKLWALRSRRASFQVDDVDRVHKTGWSVLVRADVYVATDWEVAGVRLEPWAPGAKRSWLRLIAREVTGRRLDAADFDPDPRGYL